MSRTRHTCSARGLCPNVTPLGCGTMDTTEFVDEWSVHSGAGIGGVGAGSVGLENDTAFACIQARCRSAKLLPYVSDAACALSAPKTNVPPFLRCPPIDTALLKR